MGRFDRENRTIGPIVAPPSVSPPISDSQRGGRFSRDIHGYTPKPGPGDIDWSRMNAPKGEARATTSTPSETVRDLAQRGFMSMGADPYNARKLSDISVTGASMNPIMGGVLSASDLPGHLLKGEFSKAAWDTIGMVPGALQIKRMVKGVPQVPMADTPRGIHDESFLPAREPTFPQLNKYKYPRQGPGPERPHDELGAAGTAAYGRTRTSPVLYHPEALTDYIDQTMRALRTPHGPNQTAHIVENSPEFYALMQRWYERARQNYAPITAEQFDMFRQELNSLQGFSGTAGGKAADLIDRYMVNPPEGMLVQGGPADLESLRRNFTSGRGNWRPYKTAQTIEEDLIREQSAARGALGDPGEASRRVMDYYANKAGADVIFGARPAEREVIRAAAEGTPARRTADRISQGLGGWWPATIGGMMGAGGGGMAGFGMTGSPTAGGIGAVAGAALSLGVPKAISLGAGHAVSKSKIKSAEEAIANIRRNSPLYAERSTPGPGAGASTDLAVPGQPLPYAPAPGAAPIDDPRAMQRDAVAYALLPQVSRNAESVWQQADRPFVEGIQGSPGPTMVDEMPPRVVDTTRGPIRIYVNEPEEAWQPER